MFKIIALETIPVSKEFLTKRLEENLSSYELAERELEYWKGVKVDRYDSAMKILGRSEMPQKYIFYRNYDIKDGKAMKINESKVGDKYYNGKGNVSINLCAIVGENGSGKSTILELIFRLMNNIAFALQKALDNFNSAPLFYAEGVFARLYFENEDEKFYCIEQEDLTLRWINQDNEDEVWSYTHEIDEKGGEQGLDLKKDECKKILKSLFYTIVVNYSAYALNSENFRVEWHDNDEDRIIKHKMGENRSMSAGTSDNGPREQCWIESLFHKNDAYQIPIVFNPYREKGNIDYNKEESLLSERLFLMLIENKKMIEALLGGKELHSFRFERKDDFRPMRFLVDRIVFDCMRIRDILKQLGMDKISNSFIQNLGRIIIKYWQQCYGYWFVKDIESLSLKDNDDEIATLNYVVYKTIKVTVTYGEYNGFKIGILNQNEEQIKKLVMTLYTDMSHITLKLRRAIALLTFKHYGTDMKPEISKSKNKMDLAKFDKDITKIVGNQKRAEELIQPRKLEISFSREDFMDMGLSTNKRPKWEKEELLPAPSLDTSIILIEESKDESEPIVIPFNTLSSGERQFVYALGTMMYQLHNLNTVSNNKIQYRCVNLVFDEIELYFHPKYQKQLIKRLIKVINSIGAGVIKHINVIMATHSPFILSDIPNENILYLEDGIDVSDKREVNPLGANILDIFRDSFFMGDGFIGEFAKDRIYELIRRIKKLKRTYKRVSTYEKIEREIRAIGDPFIREQLHALYLSKRYKDDKDGEAKWLRSRLNDIKNYNSHENNTD